jgi:chromosome segregation ATPase
MTTETPLIDSEAIRGAFQQWREDQEPLAAELNESLAALAAYQSHLDAWQQQLVREREELRAARDSLAAERAETDHAQDESLAETTAELRAAREKIASLNNALLARTDELRTLDGQRAEVVTELELARAREQEVKAKLEEMKQSREEEREQWSDELRHLREVLEGRLETGDGEHRNPAAERTAAERTPVERPPVEPVGQPASHSPVLGSIVEQFGKLRQQRALKRSDFNNVK